MKKNIDKESTQFKAEAIAHKYTAMLATDPRQALMLAIFDGMILGMEISQGILNDKEETV